MSNQKLILICAWPEAIWVNSVLHIELISSSTLKCSLRCSYIDHKTVFLLLKCSHFSFGRCNSLRVANGATGSFSDYTPRIYCAKIYRLRKQNQGFFTSIWCLCIGAQNTWSQVYLFCLRHQPKSTSSTVNYLFVKDQVGNLGSNLQ